MAYNLGKRSICLNLQGEAGRSVFRNQSIFDLYGYTIDESLRSNTADFYLYPSDRQRLLDELQPDHVHIMVNGRIVRSGGMELAAQLERDGYEAFR